MPCALVNYVRIATILEHRRLTWWEPAGQRHHMIVNILCGNTNPRHESPMAVAQSAAHLPMRPLVKLGGLIGRAQSHAPACMAHCLDSPAFDARLAANRTGGISPPPRHELLM